MCYKIPRVPKAETLLMDLDVVIKVNAITDIELEKRIKNSSGMDADYWSFRGKAVREHAHAYLQYPAMMVPQMQGKLISIIRELVPGIKSVYDPFIGSGTVLTEAMLQGLDFRGQDINPLAILICKTKEGPFFENALRKKIEELLERIAEDNKDLIDIDFPNIFKWFRKETAVELSKIRRAIRKEKSKWCRRFFWVALAETVRLSSNSRTSTFKLHIRPAEEIQNRNISPIDLFTKNVLDNFKKFIDIKDLLEKAGFVNKSRFVGNITLELADSKKRRSLGKGNEGPFDLLVTSPPYGDNTTTVPYGQYSYLPLQWINMSDIDHRIDESCLSTTHEIDSRSLGGIRKNALEESMGLRKKSNTFHETITNLRDERRDRATRVAAFCRDLDQSITPILDELKPNAYMIWTIGNRMVGKKIVPMDDILSELLISRGAKEITRFHRKIPSKRMAVKNNIASTMQKETILVLKKGYS
jgi:hypothetical protein